MGSKRYFQLKEMMDFFNDDFDERKYWAYGCNCLILGDRPMSDPGHGLPVDALDSVCKAYKDCVKCAQDRVLIIKKAKSYVESLQMHLFQIKPNVPSVTFTF